ncbi:MAG: hypothetical protein AB7G93_17280 [Bdellovibrionales bacterium]
MTVDYAKLIQECDAAIRAGDDKAALLRLGTVNGRLVPRRFRVSLANLCRRAGLIRLGLKVLTPVVRPGNRIPVQPTAAEKAEYALLLQRTGAVREAVEILRSIAPLSLPDTLIYQALCHFNRWNYEAAIPLLQEFLGYPLDAYKRLIGAVNLIAALIITEEFEQGAALLDETQAELKKRGLTRLLGNCHELRAQIHIAHHNLSLAGQELDEASRLVRRAGGLDLLFVDKWRSIVEAFAAENPAPITTFKARALQFGDWECVREATLFELMFIRDQERIEHLYVGTPFDMYRRRIVRSLDLREIPTQYLLGTPGSPCLDLSTGRINDQLRLAPGKKVHQLIAALLADFYRPRSLGELFSELFPDEYFSIFSSPNRMHQLFSRARAWLKTEDIPLSIEEQSGFYHLRIRESISIRVSCPQPRPSIHAARLDLLKRMVTPADIFWASEMCLRMNLSSTSFKEFIRWAMSEGFVKRFGGSSGTFYRLNVSSEAS